MVSSPRRRAGVVLAFATALAVLTGCSAPGSDEGGDARLTVAIEGGNLADGHMDIHSTQLGVGALVLRNSFDSLVWQNPGGGFEPWLATSWEVSDDELQYTFKLREDVTFHDGEPFNAEAVKLNFDHVVDPQTASAKAANLLGYAEEGGYYVDTEVVDEYTVRVNFSQPYSPFLQGVSEPQLGFYSPKVLEESLDELKAGGPGITVGTGPFILEEYTPNQQLVFRANPDYDWAPGGSDHEGPAASDELVIRILPESSSRVGAISAGEVDIATNFSPATADQLGEEVVVNAVELPGIPYSLHLNEEYGVFADQKVRKAFSIGFDIDTAVENIYFGQNQRAWSVLGPTTPNAYDPSLEGTWPYDPAEAEALLDEAGWTGRDAEGYRTKDGQRLSARWLAWTPVADDQAALADVIQSDLKKIGFEVVRDVVEPAAYNADYHTKQFDLTDWGYSGPDGDILRSHLGAGGFQKATTATWPEVDAWLNEAVATSDLQTRERLYQQIQQWNAEQVLIVPIAVSSNITASAPQVTGLTFDVSGRPQFYGASTTAGE